MNEAKAEFDATAVLKIGATQYHITSVLLNNV